MAKHLAWPEGPECSPSCEGSWSTWHDGYSTGLEEGQHPPQPEPHKPGDPHHYQLTCTICNTTGTIRLTIDPETSDPNG